MDLQTVDTMPMLDTGMNDLQVVEDVVDGIPPETEEEESLVYEETDTEMDQPPASVEGGEATISLLGFELQKEHFYMLVGLLVCLVAFFFKDQLMEIVNNLLGNTTTPAPTV